MKRIAVVYVVDGDSFVTINTETSFGPARFILENTVLHSLLTPDVLDVVIRKTERAMRLKLRDIIVASEAITTNDEYHDIIFARADHYVLNDRIKVCKIKEFYGHISKNNNSFNICLARIMRDNLSVLNKVH